MEIVGSAPGRVSASGLFCGRGGAGGRGATVSRPYPAATMRRPERRLGQHAVLPLPSATMSRGGSGKRLRRQGDKRMRCHRIPT